MTTEMTLATLTNNLQSSLENIKTDAHSLSTEDYKLFWKFSKDATDMIVHEVGGIMTELVAWSTIDKTLTMNYAQVAAKLLHDDSWKYLEGVNSVNEAMKLVLGDGKKSTISGAVAVAKMFLNCNGSFIDDRYAKSAYQCLQLVAQSTDKEYHKALCLWFSDNATCSVKTLKDKIAELKNPPVEVEATDVETEEKLQAEPKEEKSQAEPGNEKPVTEPEKSENKPLSSNAHYQLSQLRAHIDSLTKEQIKKVIDDILALG